MNYLFSLLIVLVGGCGGHQVAAISNSNIVIDQSLEKDESIENAIEPYKIGMDSLMDEVLVMSMEKLVLGQPESTLGNYVAETILSAANSALTETVDFAIMNVGGIRKEELPEGELTLGDAYELIPFDNELVVLTLNYEMMTLLFQYMCYNQGWPIAGASYEIENGLPKNIQINEEALQEGRTYRVAMSEYIANGGDKFNFLKTIDRERTDIMIRDAVIDNWKMLNEQGRFLFGHLDGRVINK